MTRRKHTSNGIVGWAMLIAVIVGSLVGCDEYNRADISDDGKTIAFSWGDKGFATDDSSEMYVFDVDTCGLKRLTVNRTCDAWADVKDQEVLSLHEVESGVGRVTVLGDEERSPEIGYVLSKSPLWISDKCVFFAVANVEDGDKDTKLKSVRFYLYRMLRGYDEIAEIPYTETTTLFSTLPAFYEDKKLYYAVADHDEKAVNVDVRSINLATKQQRSVTTFNFKGSLKKEGDWPVGYVDLAISPDDRKLICCFLPGKGISLEGFDDTLASQVYVVDTATGDKTQFGKDVSMYYPQWVPLPAASTQVATEPSKPTYRFMYLSGTVIKGGRTVWISDLNGSRVKLAQLPDKVMHGYTGWTWLGDDHVRVFHVGESGLRVVDVNAAGTEKHVRSLSRRQLLALRKQADLAGLIDYLEREKDRIRKNLVAYGDKDVSKRAEKIADEFDDQIKKLRKQLGKLGEQSVQYHVGS